MFITNLFHFPITYLFSSVSNSKTLSAQELEPEQFIPEDGLEVENDDIDGLEVENDDIDGLEVENDDIDGLEVEIDDIPFDSPTIWSTNKL